MEERKINGENVEEQATERTSAEMIDDAEAKVKAVLASGLDNLRTGTKKLKSGVAAAKSEMEKKKAESQSAGSDGTPSAQKRKKNFLIIGGAVLVALILLISLVGGRKSVNMKNYVSVTFSGLDGKGTARASVDYDSLSEIADLKVKKSDNELFNAIQLMGESLVEYSLLETAIDYELDKSTELSNGDKITVSITANDKNCKRLGIKIKNQKLSFTVQGLTKVAKFDAFADINVTFSGVAPDATATLINNSRDEAAMSYYYRLDRSSGLSNGDVVTVTIDNYDMDSIALRTGKAPAEVSKEYIVSGVSSYITELSQVSSTALDSMKREAEDALTAYVANRWESESVLAGMKYLGSYFLTRKPHASNNMSSFLWTNPNTDANNIQWLVYEVSYQNHWDSADYEMKYYYYVSFRNLYNDGAGNTVVDLANRGTPDHQYRFAVDGETSSHDYYVYGYSTLAELYKDCVTKNVENYTSESSVGE